MNRRTFIMGSIASVAASSQAGARIRRADKVRLGVIGVAGRGGDNLIGVANEEILALCDVDDTLLASAANRFPTAKTYNDFRKMIELGGLDAVVVSTPDHNHAPVTLMALEAGLHTYCEKPLTHTVFEARKVAETAKKHKRITQMGTQIHAGGNYRRVVELIQSGAIGEVKEVHTWCGRINTANGRPSDTPPVPNTLHWDFWLGPAKQRPYHPAYVPFNWRWWWDFGNGTLGDMGCHHMDLPFWALKLRHPNRIESVGGTPDSENTPVSLTVRYEFPENIKLTWYHGQNKPELLSPDQKQAWGDGNLFVGSNGMLLADYGRHQLLPEKQFEGFVAPPKTIPDSIGHHEEWIQAIKTGGTTTCNFDYSGALTECVLLGNVSYRLGKTIEWDAKRLKAKNCPEADSLIRPHYENGYRL